MTGEEATYKSPIEIFINDVNYRMEQAVLAAVSKCEIKVNKDELVKALTYDRQQYEEGYRNAMKQIPGWIPVTERLPEEDKEVLITYKGKGDELDKPYSNIDITTYGQMYFGGNKVGNYKHWRSPFQYFNDNYEVTAWMPLPEPYKEGKE